MDGILPLWKPKGMTSHDCVMKIRRIFNTKKVGHTGTLDPEVEGVLPICIGRATKIVPFLTDTKKTYIAEVKLGSATETEDSYGETIETKEVNTFPTELEIDTVLESFIGETIQIPPMYSAVKVKGRKLYEYARANESVERPERLIYIDSITKLSIDRTNHTIKFRVECSKGTYIRTLCVDIGKKLGFPAHMSFLERVQTGNFSKESTVTFARLEEASADELPELLDPIVRGVDHLAKLEVTEDWKAKIKNGQKLPRPKKLPATNPFLMMHEQELLAIYKLHEDNELEIKPVRVLKA